MGRVHEDLTGRTFGRLRVLGLSENKDRRERPELLVMTYRYTDALFALRRARPQRVAVLVSRRFR